MLTIKKVYYPLHNKLITKELMFWEARATIRTLYLPNVTWFKIQNK